MNAVLRIVTRELSVVRECTDKEVQVLLGRRQDPKRHAFLSNARDNRWWFLCACDYLLHPVAGNPMIWRLHKNQNPPAPGHGCGICDRDPTAENTSTLRAPTFSRLSEQRWRPVQGARIQSRERTLSDRSQTMLGSGAISYASQRAMLRHLMEDAGWSRLKRNLPQREIWRQFRLALRARSLSLPSGLSVSCESIAWLPDEANELEGFAWRATLKWPSERIVPEIWCFFGCTDHRPAASGASLMFEWTDLSKRTHGARLPSNRVAVPHGVGPYLAFGVGPPPSGSFSWQPTRVVLEAVLSQVCPVAVDSDYERIAVRRVQHFGLDFEKPLFPDHGGWHPDLLFHTARAVLEIQGMRSDDYRRRKRSRLADLRASREFRDWLPLTWNPNDGETVESLDTLLRKVAEREALHGRRG
jgi:hypothetical protein